MCLLLTSLLWSLCNITCMLKQLQIDTNSGPDYFVLVSFAHFILGSGLRNRIRIALRFENWFQFLNTSFPQIEVIGNIDWEQIDIYWTFYIFILLTLDFTYVCVKEFVWNVSIKTAHSTCDIISQPACCRNARYLPVQQNSNCPCFAAYPVFVIFLQARRLAELFSTQKPT